MNERFGIVVGRFQVHSLHAGHLSLIHHANRHEVLVVFLGVALTLPDEHDPLGFDVRRHVIQADFPKALVLPISDCLDDRVWSTNLDEQIKLVIGSDTAIIYGGTDSFIKQYTGSFPVETVPWHNSISGTEIREKVSSRVVDCPNFRAGIIYGMYKISQVLKVKVYATIQEDNKILMVKALSDVGWRFMGGQLSLSGFDFEQDACAEIIKAVSISISSINTGYIGSTTVLEHGSISTRALLFIGEVGKQKYQLSKDLYEMKWFSWDELKEHHIIMSQKNLYDVLINYSRRTNRS